MRIGNFENLHEWKRNIEEPLGPNDYQEKNCQEIKSYIERKDAFNFKYLGRDGSTNIYKEVYPLRLFKRRGHIYFEGFSAGIKKHLTFRLDSILMIGSLESISSEPKASRLSDFLGLFIALLVIISVFLLLILVSPKARWRYLREWIFGY